MMGLGSIRSAAAVPLLARHVRVDGVIEALMEGSAMGRTTPVDLRDRITESLRSLTGQSFGPDAVQWRGWQRCYGS
jgi:hypothetical protein